MKESIHPDYHEVTVVCACGNTFKTGSAVHGDTIKVDICKILYSIPQKFKNDEIFTDRCSIASLQDKDITTSQKGDICNKCHPFFSGKQKIVDVSGRVDKFKKTHNM